MERRRCSGHTHAVTNHTCPENIHEPWWKKLCILEDLGGDDFPIDDGSDVFGLDGNWSAGLELLLEAGGRSIGCEEARAYMEGGCHEEI